MGACASKAAPAEASKPEAGKPETSKPEASKPVSTAKKTQVAPEPDGKTEDVAAGKKEEEAKGGADAAEKKPDAEAESEATPRKRRGSVVSADAATHLSVNKTRLAQSRTIRVFVSSTFRDFALERDYMMRHALPELRKFGESRGVTVVFVDLRWGVTSEESSGGAVVKLCLQEIDACRPFFVGMLGERYGWHLSPNYKDELLEKTMDIGEQIYPWVKTYRDRSVTELEMLHGALLQPDLAEFVTFYFRQHEAFKERMKDEIPEKDLPSYEAENEHAKKGQERLKDEIRERFSANCSDYSHVKELSEMLVRDISRAIEDEFPMEASMLSPWHTVSLQHQAFAASRRMGYVAQPGIMEELDQRLDADGALAIVGLSGLGKSALLGNWVSHATTKREGLCVFSHFIGCSTESTDHYHIIRRALHFFACEFGLDLEDYLDSNTALRPVAAGDGKDGKDGAAKGEAASPYAKVDAAIPRFTEERLVEKFPDILVSVAAKASEAGKKAVLVLDGLDQLEAKAHAHTLFWIPQVPGIQYLCSIKREQPSLAASDQHASFSAKAQPTTLTALTESETSGRSLSKSTSRTLVDKSPNSNSAVRGADQALKYWEARKWAVRPIEELAPELRREVIVSYLAEHAKKLDDAQISMVLEAPPASNPLYLRTLLDEARLFGNFFELTSHLAHLLQAKTSPALYRLVLERMGDECGKDMARWAAGLVLAARDGITDQELREVLCMEHHGAGMETERYQDTTLEPFQLQGDTQVRQLVQLLFAMREQLCSTSGFLRLFHDAAKEGVLSFLGNEKAATFLLHHRLAQYFGSFSEDELEGAEREDRLSRQAHEYPHHLLCSEQFERLAAFLARRQVLKDMLEDESKKYELIRYWRAIELRWIERGEEVGKTDLRDSETNRPISSVEEYLVAVVEEAKAKADMDAFKQDPENAELRKHVEDAACLMDSISALLVLLSMYDGAVAIRQDEIAYNTVLYGSVHDKIAISCSELADVYERVYCKYDVSMTLKSRALAIDRELYGEENRQLAVGYDNLALLHLKQSNFNEAEEMYKQSLAIKEKVCGPNHRDVALTANSLGLLHEELGHYAEAHKWYQRSLDIRIKAFGPAHPSVARTQIDMGMLMFKERNTDLRLKGLPLVQQGYDSLASSLGLEHSDVAAAANNLGLVLSATDQHQLALTFHMQAKRAQLVRLGDDHPAYAATCTNIGSVCQELADDAARRREAEEEAEYFRQAEDHYSRAALIYRVKMGDETPELATTLHNLGTLFFDAVSRDFVRSKEMAEDAAAASPREKPEIEAELDQLRDRMGEMLQSAASNFSEAISIRATVFGDSHFSVKASRECLQATQDRIEAFEASGGEDIGALPGDDDSEAGGEDLVEVCCDDIEALNKLVASALQKRFGSVDQKMKVPGVGFNSFLDELSLELQIELPKESDIAHALTELELEPEETVGAEQAAAIVQSILRRVYL